MAEAFIQAMIISMILIPVGLILLWIAIGPYMRGYYKQRVKCLFGKHVAGPVEDAVGGRAVQICRYCRKPVYEYQVTKGQVRRTR